MNNLTSINREGNIVSIPLNELHCHVKIENELFMDKVEDSIKEFGLQYPVVVVPIQIKRWRDLQLYSTHILPPPEGNPEDRVLQVRCGNNRVRIARKLGYDSIDCIIVDKMSDSNDVCQKQRQKQTDWIHRGEYGKWL